MSTPLPAGRGLVCSHSHTVKFVRGHCNTHQECSCCHCTDMRHQVSSMQKTSLHMLGYGTPITAAKRSVARQKPGTVSQCPASASSAMAFSQGLGNYGSATRWGGGGGKGARKAFTGPQTCLPASHISRHALGGQDTGCAAQQTTRLYGVPPPPHQGDMPNPPHPCSLSPAMTSQTTSMDARRGCLRCLTGISYVPQAH